MPAWQSHGADDEGKQQLAAHKALLGQCIACHAAVAQVRIMETTAMKTVLTIQRMAAGTVGPTEK